jgi:hypothetical protein
MKDALTGVVSPRPTTVPEVIQMLGVVKEAAAKLDPRGTEDGIACFTTLYGEITCGVRDAVAAGLFEAGTFIVDLDVAFACRYLDAIEAMTEGGTPPVCWQELFAARSTADVPTLNYAAAGVNAHVNFDLAFALLTTWEKHPDPAARDAQHRDYCRINDIFYAKMNELRDQFHSAFSEFGEGSLLDRLGTLFGDIVVRETRDLAWDAAMRMWAHRNDEDWKAYRALEEQRQDHFAAVWGRGLIATKFLPA